MVDVMGIVLGRVLLTLGEMNDAVDGKAGGVQGGVDGRIVGNRGGLGGVLDEDQSHRAAGIHRDAVSIGQVQRERYALGAIDDADDVVGRVGRIDIAQVAADGDSVVGAVLGAAGDAAGDGDWWRPPFPARN